MGQICLFGLDQAVMVLGHNILHNGHLGSAIWGKLVAYTAYSGLTLIDFFCRVLRVNSLLVYGSRLFYKVESYTPLVRTSLSAIGRMLFSAFDE